MLDSLILAAAFLATQGNYGMPAPAAPAPRPQRSATTTQAPAAAPQPTVPAVPGKTLRDLPNVTFQYFDVAGKNLKAINKSILESQKPDASGKAAVPPTGWAIDTKFNKLTHNGQCKVTDAKATFSAKVVLPRLVPNAAHSAELTAAWRAYLAGIENAQAANLWFVYDRLPTVESAILASSCEGAPAAGNAAVQRLQTLASEFARSNVPAAQPQNQPKRTDLED
jgi:predicted secreted Zn-dependent protease